MIARQRIRAIFGRAASSPLQFASFWMRHRIDQ